MGESGLFSALPPYLYAKTAVIHLAAWLCSPVKFIRRRRRGLPGSLLPVLPG